MPEDYEHGRQTDFLVLDAYDRSLRVAGKVRIRLQQQVIAFVACDDMGIASQIVHRQRLSLSERMSFRHGDAQRRCAAAHHAHVHILAI